MGQGHRICNVDRKEYLNPHQLTDGYKLMEFGTGSNGTMTGLAILLAGSIRGGPRGGGDFRPRSDIARVIAGRWSGDRIAIVGDYYKPGDVTGCADDAIKGVWSEDGDWVDISEHVVAAMCDDPYVAEEFKKEQQRFGGVRHRSDYDPATDTFVPIPVKSGDE